MPPVSDQSTLRAVFALQFKRTEGLCAYSKIINLLLAAFLGKSYSGGAVLIIIRKTKLCDLPVSSPVKWNI